MFLSPTRVFTHFKKASPDLLGAGHPAPLGRLGMMAVADNCTFSLTLVDLKSQSVSLLLQSGI